MVHDFFVPERGGERVAVELARLLPTAMVYTSFFDPAQFGDRIDPSRGSHLAVSAGVWPDAPFPVVPASLPGLVLAPRPPRYDLVVTSSVAFTNAVRTRPDALHVSYVHTPMRYAWDLDTYLEGASISRLSSVAARAVRPTLRRWDRWAARKPDVLVANSETVRGRIRRRWGRDAEVIHPPLDIAEIPLSSRDDGFLLVAAHLLAYRRLDQAVEACTRLGRELVVVGDGSELARLQAMAGPTVRFLGHVDRPTLVDLFQRCHAYLVPGIEDFGIAPVEAMAAGKPVVGLRAGGVTESVVDGETGVLYDDQTTEGLMAAIEHLDDARSNRRHPGESRDFDVSVFRARWRDLFARLGVDPPIAEEAKT